MHSSDDFDKLAPRYPPLKPPSANSPFEFFDGESEGVEYLRDDDEFEPQYIFGDRQGGKPKRKGTPEGGFDGDENEEDTEDEADTDPTSSFWLQFKSVGPKLVPFFKTLGMYFVIFIPADRPSWFGVLIKCLPVASLALFVVLHGISMGNQ